MDDLPVAERGADGRSNRDSLAALDPCEGEAAPSQSPDSFGLGGKGDLDEALDVAERAYRGWQAWLHNGNMGDTQSGLERLLRKHGRVP